MKKEDISTVFFSNLSFALVALYLILGNQQKSSAKSTVLCTNLSGE